MIFFFFLFSSLLEGHYQFCSLYFVVEKKRISVYGRFFPYLPIVFRNRKLQRREEAEKKDWQLGKPFFQHRRKSHGENTTYCATSLVVRL